MNTKIGICVKNKIATLEDKSSFIVCSNSDYIINFSFDDEWKEYSEKTARFSYNGKHQDVVFTGTECPMPVIYNASFVTVGVFAGNLRTSTPALIGAKKSTLCTEGLPDEPSPDVYAQILDMLNKYIALGRGADGVGIEKVSLTANCELVVELTDGTVTNLGSVKGADGKDGKDGQDGKDGYTPVKGKDYFDGKDGAKGEQGKQGERGPQGESLRHSWNGTILTVTSASGTSSSNLKGDKGDKGDKGERGEKGDDGLNGQDGANGKDGQDGYTPKKGVDYWTEADKAEINGYIDTAINGALEGSY